MYSEDYDFYDILGNYYDSLQEGIEPNRWVCFVDELVKKHCSSAGDGTDGSKLLVDLGCGTGLVSIGLSKLGYDVIGIDRSSVMLSQCQNNADEAQAKLLLLSQDITEFELYGNADVFVSLLDTVNHVIEIQALQHIFEAVYEYLNAGGVFIFDIGTAKHFEKTLGANVFFQDYEDFTLLWDNQYDKESKVNEADLILFRKEADESKESYERFDGSIVERYYSVSELEATAKAAGLKLTGVYKNLELSEPDSEDERIFIVLKKEQ